MTTFWGYHLNKDKRSSIEDSGTHSISQAKHTYNIKAGKIAVLLILSDLVQTINNELFLAEETRLFEILRRTIFLEDSVIYAIRKYGKNILLEQAIIANISNWESYFSNMFKLIFDDDKFMLLNQKERKEKFDKFLKDSGLISDFNNYKLEGLKFGTFVTENKRFDFQNLDRIKIFLRLLDIDIVKLATGGMNSDCGIKICSLSLYNNKLPIDWNEIDKFFEVRHILTHRSDDSIPNNKKFVQEIKGGKGLLLEIYNKEKIISMMVDMSKIIDLIDMELFQDYDIK